MDDRTLASIKAYDASAADYQEAWKERRPRDAARKFATLAGRSARVLDVACGPAVDLRLLRDAGLQPAGGDRSGECMRVARTFFPKGLLAQWDYRQLPFPDDTFHGIWASAALQHLPRGEIMPTLAEFRRVQARGPIFASFRDGKGELEPFEDPPAGTVYSTPVAPEELRALLLGSGYTEVEVESRPDPLGRPTRWLYGWGRMND